MSRNSSGTRPESLEVVDADSDRNSQYASHAARPTSVQYVRGGVPPESVASGDAKDAGVVLETGGERGDHALLSASWAEPASAGVRWTNSGGAWSSSGAACRARSERRCSRALIASWQTWQV